MDIEKPILTPLSSVGLNCKNPLSKGDLWKSLLVPHINGNALETNSEDITLQGISLLLGTTYFHFKDVYSQLLNTKKELDNVRHDLESSVQCCMKLKEELKKAQSDCTKCTKLQKDLNAAHERSNNFQAVLLNAIKTLNPQNGSKPQSDSQTKKACNMMTQALQGTQDISILDATLTEDSPLVDIWRCAKQKRSLEAVSSPNEIHGTPENQPILKKSFRTHHRTQPDKTTPVPKMVVPELFVEEENTVSSPIKMSDVGSADRKVLCDVNLNVQTTPKKGVTKSNDLSPILGNSHKKPGKGVTPARSDDSPLDAFCDTPVTVKKRQETQDIPSPSLLNSEQFQGNKTTGIKGPLATVQAAGSSSTFQGPSKMVKLDTTISDVTYERRPGGSGLRKLKQPKLSLSSFHRAKQDISTFKEFNGGVRAQPSDLGVALLDEEKQVEKALQESLLEAERRKKEEEGFARLLQPSISDATFYYPLANIEDDFIAATPQKTTKPLGKVSATDKGTSPETLTESFQPKVTSTMVSMESSVDVFAPDFCSTAKNVLDATCTPNSNLDALVEALNRDPLSLSPPKRFESSFDRLPPREKTSPNYKYKRDPVRKKCDRQKLHGHGEHCCKEFYVENGADPNKVSRHRDHYGFQTNTPSGYWNPGFPHSLEGKR